MITTMTIEYDSPPHYITLTDCEIHFTYEAHVSACIDRVPDECHESEGGWVEIEKIIHDGIDVMSHIPAEAIAGYEEEMYDLIEGGKL